MSHHHHRPRARGGRGAWLRKRGLIRAAEPIEDERDELAWFGPPWHDGRNAVRLCEALGVAAGLGPLPAALGVRLGGDPLTSDDYEAVCLTAREASLESGAAGNVVPAAAAILANWIAHSDAGGQVPNVHLRGLVGWLLWRSLVPLEVVRWTVGVHRAADLGLEGEERIDFMRFWRDCDYRSAWTTVAKADDL